MHREELTCAKVITYYEFLATKVVVVIPVFDASLTGNDHVDSIGIFWQRGPYRLVVLRLLYDLGHSLFDLHFANKTILVSEVLEGLLAIEVVFFTCGKFWAADIGTIARARHC